MKKIIILAIAIVLIGLIHLPSIIKEIQNKRKNKKD
jgi:Sec-independent protein translocase protein TatA